MVEQHRGGVTRRGGASDLHLFSVSEIVILEHRPMLIVQLQHISKLSGREPEARSDQPVHVAQRGAKARRISSARRGSATTTS